MTAKLVLSCAFKLAGTFYEADVVWCYSSRVQCLSARAHRNGVYQRVRGQHRQAHINKSVWGMCWTVIFAPVHFSTLQTLTMIIVQIPTAKVWFEAANKLFDFLVLQKDDIESSDLLSLKNYVDVDQRFSEARCNKVFPLAVATYQENLPPHYTKKYHETKVIRSTSACLLVFWMWKRARFCGQRGPWNKIAPSYEKWKQKCHVLIIDMNLWSLVNF